MQISLAFEQKHTNNTISNSNYFFGCQRTPYNFVIFCDSWQLCERTLLFFAISFFDKNDKAGMMSDAQKRFSKAKTCESLRKGRFLFDASGRALEQKDKDSTTFEKQQDQHDF